ncbi:MAG: DMT family transporter [Terriglobales bacterium]|jgi:small multidrug resistance pump
MNWIYLFSAIVLEVGGTLSLKLSDGLMKRGPVLLMILLYGLSFFAFSHALKHMEVGTAYAIFSALGTALMASVGILWFNEPATVLKLVSLLLIILGVVGLNVHFVAARN